MAKERWGSRIGVIMAVAGSAIGLGNFLRFPGQAVDNGGSAFMIAYFISLLLLGLPLVWIEWTIGRFGGGFGHTSAPGIFHTLWNKNRFIKYFGVIGIFGPVIIYIYYSYIESWLMGYTYFAATGYSGCNNISSLEAFFNSYRGIVAPDQHDYFGGIGTAYIFFLITFVMNLLILYFGVQGGIEKVCKWGLPILFIFAIILMVRVFTIGTPDPTHPENNVINGLAFLWNPDWAKLTEPKVWLNAAGQVFFTLSIGMGVIITYSSYLTKDDDVALSGLTSASSNELAEVILGGSIVIPAAVAFLGVANLTGHTSIFDLGFLTMPMVTQQMPMGNIFGAMWFLLLFIAGITSSISMAQPAIAFLEDEFNLTKKEAVGIFGIVTFLLCHITIFGMQSGSLGEFDFWGGTFGLVLFALVESILFGWVFGIDKAWKELHHGSQLTVPWVFRMIFKYITPLGLAIILIAWIVRDFWPTITLQGVAQEEVPVRIITRVVIVLVFTLLCFMVWAVWRRKKAQENTQTTEPIADEVSGGPQP